MKISYQIENFTYEELACPCCGVMNISHISLKKLDLLRISLSYPLVINSACRCYLHNKDVGGAKESSHLCSIDSPSYAFDIKALTSSEKYKIVSKAITLGFHRIGVYKTFIHLDDDLTKRPAIWVD